MNLKQAFIIMVLPVAAAGITPAAAQSGQHKGTDFDAPQASGVVTFGCDTGPFEWNLAESIVRLDCGSTDHVVVFENCEQLQAYGVNLRKDIKKLEDAINKAPIGGDVIVDGQTRLGYTDAIEDLSHLKITQLQYNRVLQHVISDPTNSWRCPGVS